MASPVAAHAGAVVDDPSMLRYVDAVIDAFGQGDIDQGLTRSQIIDRALRAGDLDRDELEHRIDVFVELAMLLPYHDKAHQQRYVINTDAVAGNLFFRKGLTEGGIEELLQLLGATADAIEAGRHDLGRVAAALVEQRGYVEMWTAAVNRLTDIATGNRAKTSLPRGISLYMRTDTTDGVSHDLSQASQSQQGPSPAEHYVSPIRAPYVH